MNRPNRARVRDRLILVTPGGFLFGILLRMNLTDIRNDIFARRPAFKKVIETWGEKTLLEYYTQDFKPLHESSSAVFETIQKATNVLVLVIGISRKDLKCFVSSYLYEDLTSKLFNLSQQRNFSLINFENYIL